MTVLKFLKSPIGNLTLFVVLATGGGWMIHRANLREKKQAEQLTRIEDLSPAPLRESILRSGQPLTVPPPAPRAPTAPATSAQTTGPNPATNVRPNSLPHPPTPATKPHVLPISLFSGTPANESPALSKTFAPFGRLIPCETVITIESSKLDTPVIGLVTDDVWHNGQLIIPAGAEIHGRASLDRARERIA